MNKCYVDTDQESVVKICATAESARREVEGARVFQKYVRTSMPKIVDSKTIVMRMVQGKRGTSVSQTFLNKSVLDMLSAVIKDPVSQDKRSSQFSIRVHIYALMKKYAYSADISSFLINIQKDIEAKPFFPIHGDLQKQNMFINPAGELTLIDFEHFCYAPIEFELVNSMFHSDGNCLDIQFLLRVLKKAGRIDDELIRKALVLYALKRV